MPDHHQARTDGMDDTHTSAKKRLAGRIFWMTFVIAIFAALFAFVI